MTIAIYNHVFTFPSKIIFKEVQTLLYTVQEFTFPENIYLFHNPKRVQLEERKPFCHAEVMSNSMRERVALNGQYREMVHKLVVTHVES